MCGICETCEAVSCSAPGLQKGWVEAAEAAWVEARRALDARSRLNGRVNFGILAGSGEDGDELEREEP